MKDPVILAIDTATEGCSAALLQGDSVVEQFEVTPRGHTQRILPMVDTLLNEADVTLNEVDAIAFNRGPGSFTGLRITAGVVQGLAYGAALPVIPVSSLAALASAQFRASGDRQLLSAIDARMGEIYWGAYIVDEYGRPQLLGEEQVSNPSQLQPLEGSWSGVGTGWAAFEGELRTALGCELKAVEPDALPHAAEIARLARMEWERGAVLTAEKAQPIYLRNNIVR